MNLTTQPLDYRQGGGQDIPSFYKSKLRTQNSKKRFQIIKPFIRSNSLFIDIGSGSGEMLSVATKYCRDAVGFDTNMILIDFCKKNGLNVINAWYDINKIPGVRQYSQRIFALSHVLEHVGHPQRLLEQIHNDMQGQDVLYIEVPLHTGFSFQKRRYQWTLWYDEHVALYSQKSLLFIADWFCLDILDIGYRNFFNDSKSKRMFFETFISHPGKFLLRAVTKRTYQTFMDNIARDYGFILLKKPMNKTKGHDHSPKKNRHNSP